MKNIVVLGTGCAKCQKLEEQTKKAVLESGLDAKVTKEEDIMKIMQYGVMTTPALVVDNKVVMKGSVPSVDDIIALISK
ncbi:thioredoxin family protein [Halosquirtibacter laminarini]|uniref:Thioredoxin family protein n=1 Tax=Halosquirtibacter laminarini TaxID=3374600 RepID=A0AC61NJ14_9BACT|nr:thioredoxin family protein [Prolixibacteraceae bacterium]